MKILLTGRNGQLGREIQNTRPADVVLLAPGRQELDILSPDTIQTVIENFSPDVIFNCAAYTQVDRAETEQETAYAVNATAVRNIATVARDRNIKVVHVSTDFVFDGMRSAPYLPESATNPLGIYGKSKAEGERFLREICPGNSIIIRTSWLYSIYGHNFVKTMLNLMQSRSQISVVSDQIGTPTWAHGLANAIWDISRKPAINGILHWSDAGAAGWYDFACAIMEESLAIGLLHKPVEIIPVGTSAYSTPARRPPYSVLDKRATWEALGYYSPHWRVALRNMLKTYKVMKSPADHED
jgi:dTDP-4-dehydrorhamnose reductase